MYYCSTQTQTSLRPFATFLAIFLSCLLGFSHSVLAQEPPPTSTPTTQAAVPDGIARAPVVIKGRTLFDLSGSTLSEAVMRADKVNRRLQLLIERDEKVESFLPEDVTETDGLPLISLGGEPVLTIINADVQDNLTPAPQLAEKWGKKLSDNVIAARIARKDPFHNALIVIITAAYDLGTSIIRWLPRLMGVLLLALLFWPLAKFARYVAGKVTKGPRLDPNLTQLAIAVAFYGMWALGLLAMLSAMGINSAGIAAAIGASGFVLGFAFQDVLSHFFAGMLLLMGRQFYIGSQIKVGEYEGVVERIDLRALYLRAFDNRQITIPNGQVFNSAVETYTSHPFRRREFSIGIGYESNAREAMRIAEQVMRSVDGVLEDPPPQALVNEISVSSVKLRMFFYTSTSNFNWLETLSNCILGTKEAFEKADIDIPFSTHTIDVRHVGEMADALKPMLDKDGKIVTVIPDKE